MLSRAFHNLMPRLVLVGMLGLTLSGCAAWGNSRTAFLDGSKIPATIAGNDYTLTVANSVASRQKGLSGITSLPAKDGMLFVFDNNDKHSFWMKDTQVPLDIIWLDKTWKVVSYKQMIVEPDPANPQWSYTPDKEARYAIELNLNTLDSSIVGKSITVHP
jgi:uncharacterized membrane protein (UPF0127 family)